jgi:flagellar biosynthesis/type III secretory pathway protein FliH
MSQTVTIRLEKPIASAKLLGEGGVEATTVSAEAELLELQKRNLSQVCQALQDATNKVNELQRDVFKNHKEQIAKLSVAIARKILVQKVQDGNYEIESIVEEALKNAPTLQDVVVHLNPEDLVQYQKTQQENTAGTLVGIKFVGDPNIGRAECLLETPKGIIESLIDEHLERIGKALKKVE